MICAHIAAVDCHAKADLSALDSNVEASALVRQPIADFSITGLVVKIFGQINAIPRKTGACLNLITEVKLSDYLKVDKDVLWVTPDIIEQLNIMSNVQWNIT